MLFAAMYRSIRPAWTLDNTRNLARKFCCLGALKNKLPFTVGERARSVYLAVLMRSSKSLTMICLMVETNLVSPPRKTCTGCG